MQIIKYINSIFSSNTYLIYKNNEQDVWIVDPGDSQKIINWIRTNNKTLKGILLTHSHFDHIYGVNDFYEEFPTLKIYSSKYAKDGLFCARTNGSLYKEIPFVVHKQDISVIKEGDSVRLWNNVFVNVFETPGHGRDSLSFQVENNLFTGDALIPGIKVFTKMKYGDKAMAEESINRIFECFDNNTMIWPGHKDNYLLAQLKYTNLLIEKI